MNHINQTSSSMKPFHRPLTVKLTGVQRNQKLQAARGGQSASSGNLKQSLVERKENTSSQPEGDGNLKLPTSRTPLREFNDVVDLPKIKEIILHRLSSRLF